MILRRTSYLSPQTCKNDCHFLVDLIEKYKDDFDIVTELIEVLDDSYRSITDKSKKAAIENNRMNEMFLERLKLLDISRHIEKMMINFV